MQIDSTRAWENLRAIREMAPLIQNITNTVVMEQTANALLAIGASPVMTEAVEEAAEMAQIAQAVVLNMGTLTPRWQLCAKLAAETANGRNIPLVFDPVGVGATPFRTEAAHSLLYHAFFTVIRGNASEVGTLAGKEEMTKGVDSSTGSLECLEEARKLAVKTAGVIVVSGAVDFITDGNRGFLVRNGHPIMQKVTGMGCTATALIAAFAATEKDSLIASVNAMIVMGIAGELAAKKSDLPGSFKTAFIDQLFSMSESDISQNIRLETV